jgi:hypothetical protein
MSYDLGAVQKVTCEIKGGGPEKSDAKKVNLRISILLPFIPSPEGDGDGGGIEIFPDVTFWTAPYDS